MARVTAPLLSFGAGGSIGQSLVMSKWRGIPYARRYVIPANPNTVAQQAVRSTFALLREMWKLAPAGLTAPWDSFAQGRPFTGMNKFVGENVRVLNSQPDMTNFIGSPGAKGGLPPDSVTPDPAPAVGTIEIAMVSPAAPSGWTLVGGAGIVFPQQDPAAFFEGPIIFEETAGVDPTLLFEGLTTATEYVYSVWLVWTKPDGKTAYSVSTTGVDAAG